MGVCTPYLSQSSGSRIASIQRIGNAVSPRRDISYIQHTKTTNLFLTHKRQGKHNNGFVLIHNTPNVDASLPLLQGWIQTCEI